MSANATVLEETARALIEPRKGAFLGFLFSGFMADTILLGVMMHQTQHFFRYGRKEFSHWVSVDTLILMIFHLAITFYTWSYLLDIFAYKFGEYSSLTAKHWIGYYNVMDAVPIALSHFAYNAYKFNSRNKFIPILTGSFILISAGASFASSTFFLRQETALDPLSTNMQIASWIWIAGALTADTIIASGIMYALLFDKVSSPTFTGRLALLRRLAHLTRECQLPPLVLHLAVLIIYRGRFSNLAFFFIQRFMSKIYPVTRLWVINARYNLRASRNIGHSTDGEGTSQSQSFSMNKLPERTVIHVQTETYDDKDLNSQKTLVPAAGPPHIQLSSPRHKTLRGHHPESLSSNESEEYTDSTYKEPVDGRNGSVVGLGGDGDSRRGLTLRN
ncbi:hypothetical protein L202_04844 [Cryptococcus amylolentus CBS 6039]|uniref:Uncharacterized protein n=2 Tax=Cryptococcus amylolentus TaxID=104669 RepID=A0A1E3HMY1_9TREE|nr:hypothetical protein L202_04844 [Cryptococcus amylolentus CBS 6039]ODN77699.1 hypothetical protein L202_04844 [Cryptococcus amylolentus CBS 6039]ODO05709.1 hypothetical protein I350_04769 [Cryptococcus amylolentus CBS 6273]